MSVLQKTLTTLLLTTATACGQQTFKQPDYRHAAVNAQQVHLVSLINKNIPSCQSQNNQAVLNCFAQMESSKGGQQ